MLYLLMMDADGFKQINDLYGYVEGDHALQVVATALKDACSPGWWLYRTLWRR